MNSLLLFFNTLYYGKGEPLTVVVCLPALNLNERHDVWTVHFAGLGAYTCKFKPRLRDNQVMARLNKDTCTVVWLVSL